MDIFTKLPRSIIKKAFDFSVSLIEKSHDMKPFEDKVEKLRKMPDGSLGHDIAKCLDSHGLRLVPKFESHDLKHVLLQYEMTPVDEIRMQAFMLGNGNHTLPCFAILAFGLLLLPGQWMTFCKDFKAGRHTKPVSAWTIESHAEKNTGALRREIIKPETEKTSSMETITKFLAGASVFAGIFGMLFCLPFLFSSVMADLVGAGFPFVGGAILTVGGLLAWSNLQRRQPRTVYITTE